MKIKMTQTAAGPAGVYHAGTEVDVPDALATALVSAGAAYPADGIALPAPEIAPTQELESVVDSPVAIEPEKPWRPRGRTRKGAR